MSRRFLLSPFGSEGDVNPLIWLGRHLAARGHQVEFLITPNYAPLASRHGFRCHPLGSEDDFHRLAGDPALWQPMRGTWRVAQAMHDSLPACRTAFEAAGSGFDLVVTSSFALGTAALAEARGIPRLMLHLQPMCLRSRRDMPVPGPGAGWFPHAPGIFQNGVFAVVDAILNRTMLPPLNDFRASLGLPRHGDFYRDALLRSGSVALLFPDWFAPPQPDWPPGVRQFDFPLDLPSPGALPESLRDWLDRGPPPVLWTHGSANVHLRQSQELARQVTNLVGGRALLVGRIAPDFPLPDNMLHFPAVPFEDVFPHCRAVVHHGGIGTTAKAFAAGLPQMVLPLAHDQHDNAARITRLRAGLEARASVRHSSRILRQILTSADIAEGVAKCRSLASRSPAQAAQLADLAESLANREK